MKPKREHPEPLPPEPPAFVMWQELPSDSARPWKRQWFGHELAPHVPFIVRGIGIREPLFNQNIHRFVGTGDWLIMLFHDQPRLDWRNAKASHPALTLVIWAPGAEQFYSWNKRPNKETHSWIHIEGTLVAQQIDAMKLPVNTPFPLPDDTVMMQALERLFDEMQHGQRTDAVILHNIFENWARGIHRQIQPEDAFTVIPPSLLRVRQALDADFRRIPPLSELAKLAAMSPNYLCHRFRVCFGSTISAYVIRKRMAAAQRLLFEVRLRASDIAEAVGYSDVFQFSKQFKKTFGTSPLEYRRRQMKVANSIKQVGSGLEPGSLRERN